MTKNNKIEVALIGPIKTDSGIATAVNTVVNNSIIRNNYTILYINTSNYENSNSLVNSIIFIKSLSRYLRQLMRNRISIAHIHTSHDRSFYRKSIFISLSLLFKIKIILHIHSSKFDSFFVGAYGIKKKIIGFFLKKCDAIILLCQDWKEKIDRKFNVKHTFVIGNASPLNPKQAGACAKHARSNGIKILFFGFLIKTKGISDIIDIAAKLKENSASYRIIVGGKGQEKQNLIKDIKEKDLHNVEYQGWVSGRKKLELYRNSDIFILPSYNEGMPMVILEAMAFGLPIIATRIAGIPDIVVDNENGYLLNPGDVNGFVEKIELLALNPGLRKSFGNRSKTIVKSFSADRIAAKWQQIYQAITSEVYHK